MEISSPPSAAIRKAATPAEIATPAPVWMLYYCASIVIALFQAMMTPHTRLHGCVLQLLHHFDDPRVLYLIHRG